AAAPAQQQVGDDWDVVIGPHGRPAAGAARGRRDQRFVPRQPVGDDVQERADDRAKDSREGEGLHLSVIGAQSSALEPVGPHGGQKKRRPRGAASRCSVLALGRARRYYHFSFVGQPPLPFSVQDLVITPFLSRAIL